MCAIRESMKKQILGKKYQKKKRTKVRQLLSERSANSLTSEHSFWGLEIFINILINGCSILCSFILRIFNKVCLGKREFWMCFTVLQCSTKFRALNSYTLHFNFTCFEKLIQKSVFIVDSELSKKNPMKW